MNIISRIITSALVVTLVFSASSTATVIAASYERGPKDKITIIHFKDGNAKPVKPGGGGNSELYAFLAKGVKWKTLPVTYFINPTNKDGLSTAFVTEAISAGAEVWDENTGAELFAPFTPDTTATYDGNGSGDGRNEMVFGNLTDPNIIAVTTIWGYFGGAVQTRMITETDILFNNYYVWGDATVSLPPNLPPMDLQNIATHEIGHVAGLNDLYNAGAQEQTMYGYSTQSEIKKRTLNSGDIAGIKALYGN